MSQIQTCPQMGQGDGGKAHFCSPQDGLCTRSSKLCTFGLTINYKQTGSITGRSQTLLTPNPQKSQIHKTCWNLLTLFKGVADRFHPGEMKEPEFPPGGSSAYTAAPRRQPRDRWPPADGASTLPLLSGSALCACRLHSHRKPHVQFAVECQHPRVHTPARMSDLVLSVRYGIAR